MQSPHLRSQSGENHSVGGFAGWGNRKSLKRFVTPANHSVVFPTLLSRNSEFSPKSSIFVIICFKNQNFPRASLVHKSDGWTSLNSGNDKITRSSSDIGRLQCYFHEFSFIKFQIFPTDVVFTLKKKNRKIWVLAPRKCLATPLCCLHSMHDGGQPKKSGGG